MFPKQQIPVNQVGIDGGFDNAYWTGLIADQVMGGQEKISGTLMLYGIQAPICEGDNLDYEGNLYHIERVMHRGIVDGDAGVRRFFTTLDLTNGLATNQPSSGIAYPALKPFAPSAETLPISQVDPAALDNDNNYSVQFNLSDDSAQNMASVTPSFGDFENDPNSNNKV